ncbi:MAG: WecB/TagA/CpsF family glycosyltransferase [Candidatus Omnitrophota bacterium]|nr:WecB/TagA/CpsF family glycosyltransferase [Candidatus Omnitrophota bacterium]
MDKKFNFLGLNFHNVTFSEAEKKLECFIAEKKPHMVFMPNAELIVRAGKDSRLRKVYNDTHFLLVDSYVVYYAARLFRKPISEPINGARLMFSFLDTINKKGYRIYLLGAEEKVLFQAIENLKVKYPELKIAGRHHGYFDFDNDDMVVQSIRESKADVLFVAMSSPLKENFVAKNLEKMDIPVCMGVGGSVDVIAGKCQMAPLWVSKIGMEWFYRFIQDPRRLWKRYTFINIKFLGLLMKEFLNGIFRN